MARMKLKPCPFCGEQIKPEIPTVMKVSDYWVISHYCSTLRRTGGTLGPTMDVYGSTKAEAIKLWNTRAGRG